MADNRKSLTAYLAQAYLLPLFPEGTVPAVQQHAPLWPVMEELNCNPLETRDLTEVTEIPLLAVENAIRTYFIGFENKLRVEWPNSCLKMPCPDVMVPDNSVLSRLKIRDARDYLKATQYFILDTAAEAIRTIEKRQFDDDELNYTRMRAESKYNSRKVCTFWVFGAPTGLPRVVTQGLIVFSLPPWEFGPGDFQMFARNRKFARGELDRETPGGPMWNNVDKLWAMTYDVCKNFGFKWFVVTTYSHWVFGTWSSNWTAAEVTAVLPFDKTQGVTLVEMLVFWTQSGREKVRYWHTPADVDR